MPEPKRTAAKLPPSRYFPPAESADADGFLGIGGELSPEWLLDAYRHGIFPWPPNERVLAWFSPDPRAVIEFAELHVSRRLRDTLRSRKFSVTFDQDFAGVIDGCATGHGREEGTWITPSMRKAYVRMHELGHAHSVEVWHDDGAGNRQLAGGTYGVAIGGLFAAESMFYRVTDASKVAVVRLVEHLQQRGFTLLDIQQLTPHTGRLGAKEIPRREYLRRVAAAIELPVSF